MKIKNTTIYRLTLYAALTGQMCILFGLPMRINGLVSFGVACIAATNIMAFATVLFERYQGSISHCAYLPAGNYVLDFPNFYIRLKHCKYNKAHNFFAVADLFSHCRKIETDTDQRDNL